MSLCLYKDFCYPSYDYQTGFGARLIPTKREAVALPTAESLIPLEAIVIKKRDYEAEAVAKKAIEEGRGENELERMRAHGDTKKASMVLLEHDEMVLPAVTNVFPGQAEAHSVPLPAVLPQQAQLVDSTTSSTSSRPVAQHHGGEVQPGQVQPGQGEVVVDDNTPLAALQSLQGTEGLRVRFSDQPQGSQSTCQGDPRAGTQHLQDQQALRLEM